MSKDAAWEKAATDAGRRLIEAGQASFVEEMLTLRGKIRAHILSLELGGARQAGELARVRRMLTLVDDVKLVYTATEPAAKDGKDRPTVTMVQNYPDALHDWMMGPTCPSNVAEHLAGGRLTENEEATQGTPGRRIGF